MADRPTGVTILAIWLIIGAILSIILYYFDVFKTENLFLTAPLSVILNAIGLIIAYGLLKGLSWAWASAILLVIFGLVALKSQIFGNRHFQEVNDLLDLLRNLS